MIVCFVFLVVGICVSGMCCIIVCIVVFFLVVVSFFFIIKLGCLYKRVFFDGLMRECLLYLFLYFCFFFSLEIDCFVLMVVSFWYGYFYLRRWCVWLLNENELGIGLLCCIVFKCLFFFLVCFLGLFFSNLFCCSILMWKCVGLCVIFFGVKSFGVLCVFMLLWWMSVGLIKFK